jgi:HK97 family phage portal protein
MLERLTSIAGGISAKFGPSLGGEMYQIGFAGSANVTTTPARGSSAMLQEFCTNTLLQSQVDRIAQDIASVPWRVVRVNTLEPHDETQWQDVSSVHPLGKFLDHPCEDFSWHQLLYISQVYLELLGECFFLLDRPNGAPAEMLPIPPNWVTRRPGVDKDDYTISVYGRGATDAQEFPREQVIWIRKNHPGNPWIGLGKAFAVDDDLMIFTDAMKWNRMTLVNGAHPGTVIGVKGLGPQEQKRMQADFESRFGGFRNHGKPLVIGADVSVADLSKSQRDMDFLGMLKFVRDTAHQNWNVPPELLGIVENSNRASIDSAMYIHATNNLMPRLRVWATELNRRLASRFGDASIRVVYENPVRETAEVVLQQTNEGLTRGAITVNEWRRKNGFPAVSDGDVRLVPNNTAPDGMLANQAPGAPPVGPKTSLEEALKSWK